MFSQIGVVDKFYNPFIMGDKMALSNYIRSITEMNNLTASISNSDEIIRYSKSDIFWATKKKIPLSSRTVLKGDVYQFEFGKNFLPEMSYEHRGLVIGVAGKLLYVLPICSYNATIPEHVSAYHPIDNINPRSNFYLLKDTEFPFLKHDSVLKLNDLKTLSVNRIMFQQGNISIKSQTYTEIERMAFGKCFPIFSFEFDRMKNEISKLTEEVDDKVAEINSLNETIRLLREEIATTTE